MSAHLEIQMSKRRIDLQEIKATIEEPDITTGERNDPEGVKYSKAFGNRRIWVCVSESGKPRLAKTAWVNYA